MVQILLDDVQNFNDSILINIKEKIQNMIQNNNFVCTVKDLTPVLNALETLSNFFDSLKTEHFRLQTLEDMGLLIRPKQIVIAHRLNDRLHDGLVILEPKPVKIILTPLRFVLKKVFEHSNFFDMLLNYTKKLEAYNGKIMYSFVQSEMWKAKLKFHQNKMIFPLFLYFDDLDINNPLGSHAGNQKLGAVYISLACLPPELLPGASSLNHILLASLFKTDDKKQYGNQKIFKDLISELNYLETTGIEITINNEIFQIYFSVCLILGDNLGLHSILGFVESFVAKYPCRFCKSSRSECQNQLEQNSNNLRDLFNYNGDIITNNVSQTGIKEKCVWENLNSFNVTDNYSVNIMHDMLEGVCKYDIGLILKYMIFELKYFTVDTLNNRIETFNYGPIDIRNRPTLLSTENLKLGIIKMSAAESLCFTRYLGLIIGDLVPEKSEVWSLYIVLKQIIDIIFSKWIRLDDSVLLKCLISEHHALYLKLFRTGLKPKHHHMVHYPLNIQKSGPLAIFSSIRYEAKHKELKDAANAITSRKNIAYTLSLKQQLQLSYRLLSSNHNLYTIPIQFGRVLTLDHFTLETYNTRINFLNKQFNFCVDNIKFVSWGEYQRYKL